MLLNVRCVLVVLAMAINSISMASSLSQEAANTPSKSTPKPGVVGI